MTKHKDEKKDEAVGEKDAQKEAEAKIKKTEDPSELAEKYLNNWKRAVADFENYKKRQTESTKEFARYASLDLVLQILPVLDNFHASTDHIPEAQKSDPWVTGIMHIRKQLEKVLEDNGVAEIAVKAGDGFNPELHEAIKQESGSKNQESGEFKNIISKVILKGYKIDGKVIRPARVVVE